MTISDLPCKIYLGTLGYFVHEQNEQSIQEDFFSIHPKIRDAIDLIKNMGIEAEIKISCNHFSDFLYFLNLLTTNEGAVAYLIAMGE